MTTIPDLDELDVPDLEQGVASNNVDHIPIGATLPLNQPTLISQSYSEADYLPNVSFNTISDLFTPSTTQTSMFDNLNQTDSINQSNNMSQENDSPPLNDSPRTYNIKFIPPCSNYGKYYHYLYQHLQDTPYLSAGMQVLLEVIIPLTTKRDLLFVMTYDNPTKWDIYLNSLGFRGEYTHYKDDIIKLLTIWNILENTKGNNRVIKLSDFEQQWLHLHTKFAAKFSREPNKLPPPYNPVSPLLHSAFHPRVRATSSYHTTSPLFGRRLYANQDNQAHIKHNEYYPVPPDLPHTQGHSYYSYKNGGYEYITLPSSPKRLTPVDEGSRTSSTHDNISQQTKYKPINDKQMSSQPNKYKRNSLYTSSASVISNTSVNSYKSNWSYHSLNSRSSKSTSKSSKPSRKSSYKSSKKSTASTCSRSTYSRSKHHDPGITDDFSPGSSSNSFHKIYGTEPFSPYSHGGNQDPDPDFDPPQTEIPSMYRYKPHRARPKYEKAQWDGTSRTFRQFARSLEGHMLQVGAGYTMTKHFYKQYTTLKHYLHSDAFWHEYCISIPQAKYDITYLYGILKSATATKENKTLNRHKESRDGIRTWHELVKEYQHGGTIEIRVKSLESTAASKFSPHLHGTIDTFLNDLEGTLAELMTLIPTEYPEARARKIILSSVGHIDSISDILLHCDNHPTWGYRQTSEYIREKSFNRAYLYADQRNIKAVTSEHTSIQSEISEQDVISIFDEHVSQYGPNTAWKILNVKQYRESLSIPTPIWMKLEPQFQEKISKIRQEIKESRAKNASLVQNLQKAPQSLSTNVKPTSQDIPLQYPDIKGVTSVANTLATALEQITVGDVDSDTTDEDLLPDPTQVAKAYMTRVATQPILVRAHLELVSEYDKVLGIPDGGADSCVVGRLAFVKWYTGRFAYIVGYDPANTQPKKVPIVTAYLKVRSLPHGIIVILEVNEAPFNEGSPITLISEYQVREYGLVIDSVASKHKSIGGTYGTQRLYLNDVVSLPFEDKGGIMGFEILPFDEGDEDIYDVFPITSKEPWNPHKFRHINYSKYTLPDDCHFSFEGTQSSSVSISSVDESMPSLDSRRETEISISSNSLSTASIPSLKPRKLSDLSSMTSLEKDEKNFDVPQVIIVNPQSMTLSEDDKTWFSLVQSHSSVRKKGRNRKNMLERIRMNKINRRKKLSQKKYGLNDGDAWNVWNRSERFDNMKRVLQTIPTSDSEPKSYDPNDHTLCQVNSTQTEIWYDAEQDPERTQDEDVWYDACEQEPVSNLADQLMNEIDYDVIVGKQSMPTFIEGYPHYCNITDENDLFTDTNGQPHDIPLLDPTQPMISSSVFATRAWHRIIHKQVNPNSLKKFFLGRPKRIITKTLEMTTQLATMVIRHPLRRHVKNRAPKRLSTRIDETVSTDPLFANVPSIFHGFLGLQTFFCRESKCIMIEGFQSKGEFPNLYKDFMRKHGVPSVLRRDNSKEQCSEAIAEINRERGVKDEFSEPYNPQQNPVELNAIKFIKESVIKLLTSTGAPIGLWYFAAKLVVEVYNFCSNPHLPDGMSPIQYLKGETPDISAYLQFTFYQRVLYYDHENSFPVSKERSGRWLGVSDNTGDSLTFLIWDEQSKQVLSRSVVRPFYNNLHVKWDPRLSVHPDNQRKTASIAGEVMPDPKLRKKKLDEAMDEYDELEEEPLPHNTMPIKQEITHSILKKDDEAPEMSEKLLVPTEIKKNSIGLYFGHNPLPQKKDYDPLTWEGKKPYHDKRTKNLYTPMESPQAPIYEEHKVTFDKGTKMLDKSKQTGKMMGNNRQNKPGKHPMQLRARSRKSKLVKGLLAIGVTMVQFTTGISDVQPKLQNLPSLMSESIEDYKKPLHNADKLEHLRAYHARLDLMKEVLEPEPKDYEWNIQGIDKYRLLSGRPYFKVKYFGKVKQWLPMDTLRLHDPFLVIRYGTKHSLLSDKGWEWVKHFAKIDELYTKMVKTYKATVRKNKIKFGIEVPYSTKEALRLDMVNMNDSWRKAIDLEVQMLLDFKTFITLEDDQPVPVGYKWIPYHCVYDAKFDGRLKARLVAGGHMTNPTTEDVFSGVVGMETVRLGFILARLNNLLVCAGDVSQAFLYGKTREKVYIIGGDEFPEHMRGKRLIIDKALYGLKSSSARFHEHSSEKLRIMGFRPTKVDADLWYRKQADHYEYIARYVDDLIAFSRKPMEIMEELQKTYHMKGVGKPQYYLGGDVLELGPEWEKENISTAFSAETYIRNALPRLAKACGVEQFRICRTPFSDQYHPEHDESPLLDEKNITLYKSLIGSANWIVTLGRFDIAYSVSTFARYSMAPREGHLENLKKLFGYLRGKAHGKILIDISEPPVRNIAMISKNHNWSEFYPDAKEEVPEDALQPMGRRCMLTCYVDSDHARDQVTRRSVTGIILLLNNTPLVWVSKRQGTVETSTYGAELIATRMAVELLIAWRYNLRMLGAVLEDESYMLGDNMSVVLNTTIPSSILKKKNQSCNWHKVREAIAGGFIIYGHIKSEDNVADICTKPLGGPALRRITSQYLFRRPQLGEINKCNLEEDK